VSSTSSIAPYSSSSQFLEAGHTTHEEEEEDDEKEVNNSSREQVSLWNNQSNGLKSKSALINFKILLKKTKKYIIKQILDGQL